MITVLTNILQDFPGPANRVRCMAHIVNLVVKIILKQFDQLTLKKKGIQTHKDELADANNSESDLANLVEDQDNVSKLSYLI